jgi:hypothetical protein
VVLFSDGQFFGSQTPLTASNSPKEQGALKVPVYPAGQAAELVPPLTDAAREMFP